ncbi:MAG: copper transporter [Actinobacteria bacterium]|nr:copper transporter [Actinomycetota bacterium]
MIDFRYYIVAITAIFAALITGLLLGSSLTTSEVTKRQQESLVESIKKDINNLREEMVKKNIEIEQLKEYQKLVRTWLVNDRLSGRNICIISFNSKDNFPHLNEIKKELVNAGATLFEITINSEATETTFISTLLQDVYNPDASKKLEPFINSKKISISNNFQQAQEVLLLVDENLIKLLESDPQIKEFIPIVAVAKNIKDAESFIDLAPENSRCIVYDGDYFDSEALILSFFSTQGGIFGESSGNSRIIPEYKKK